MPDLARLARLDRICSGLSPADAAWLRDRLEPPWRRNRRRREERDEAIRQFSVHFPTASSGRALANAMRSAFLRMGALRHKPVGALARDAHRVFVLAGRVPGLTMIRDALAGRTGRKSLLVSGHPLPNTDTRSGAESAAHPSFTPPGSAPGFLRRGAR